PNWLDAQVDQLQNAEFGPQWGALINMWLELEETLGFPLEGKALSNQNHPKSITDWIQCAQCRREKFKPSINPKVFGVQWWKWWSTLQPAWRNKSPDGIVLAGQNVVSDWTCLMLGRKNGILAIMISLQWWREALVGEN
ncbi:hypothetical protein BS47DRAFT_1273544, partial [Hydnum rufescens UP504]